MRAIRQLLTQMAICYGLVDFRPNTLSIHAVSTIAVTDETTADPYLNMLSNTHQAMAGILGGCNRLTILPHTEGLSAVTPFAERIARNVAIILKEEAYFDKVADPAMGAYYMEILTEELAKYAWICFQQKI